MGLMMDRTPSFLKHCAPNGDASDLALLKLSDSLVKTLESQGVYSITALAQGLVRREILLDDASTNSLAEAVEAFVRSVPRSGSGFALEGYRDPVLVFETLLGLTGEKRR
jgi:hypothetical protein